jgi:hypothetical protein
MDKTTLDTYHYHEAMDRAYMLAEIASNILEEHPVVTKHVGLQMKFNSVIDAINEMYQTAAQLAHENGG